ncbi:tetraacyldisaccharide 4'-kinase [Pedobacter sp. BAL39]|uniref:tetraacyldisaccharide 4'-kinase n=1 Tax=Pedobacter sp. BAL39 TaxID=391596 RepID=UPI00068295F5|nr:tetraacyldisaccharide 4'-kinase [Pedobacter sp. BAL39]
MMRSLRLLLWPFSLVYGLVVLLRNLLYDTGVFKSTAFALPVICVGNLVVGGSGKSPSTEYLIRLLSGYKIAILSRGYGRKTKGFILADEHATASHIGDEPMQFYRKFPDVTVAVCEDRVRGVSLLKDQHDLIILDDAYQHRRIRAGMYILLFEFSQLLRPQFLLPAGNLRESFRGYRRADAILVTKAPSVISKYERNKCLSHFDKDHEVSFSSLAYQQLVPLFGAGQQQINPSTVVFLITGIANPRPLLTELKKHTSQVIHHDYPDHYQFKEKDVEAFVEAYHKETALEKLLLTTEKDAQRLLGGAFKEILLNLPIFYLPVRIDVHQEDKDSFDRKILDYVASHTRDR